MLLFTLLLGFVMMQGTLVSIYFLWKKPTSEINTTYFIFLNVIISFICFQHIARNNTYFESWQWIFQIGHSFFFLIGPFHRWTISSKPKNWLIGLVHILPFSIVLLIQFFGISIMYTKYINAYFLILQLLFYSTSGLDLSRIKKSGRKNKMRFWLQLLMLSFAVIVSANAIMNMVFQLHLIDIFSIVLTYAGLTISIITVSILLSTKKSQAYYQNSNLKNLNLTTLRKEFHLLMEEKKMFRNANLRADEVARKLGISRHQFTEFLNVELKKSFSQILNKYRLEEAKKLLLSKDKSHLSINGIANESGFKSSSSFYRLFKEQNLTTPREFILSNRNDQ